MEKRQQGLIMKMEMKMTTAMYLENDQASLIMAKAY